MIYVFGALYIISAVVVASILLDLANDFFYSLYVVRVVGVLGGLFWPVSVGVLVVLLIVFGILALGVCLVDDAIKAWKGEPV